MPKSLCKIALTLACVAGVANGRSAQRSTARAQALQELENIGDASIDSHALPTEALATFLLALGSQPTSNHLFRKGHQGHAGRLVKGGPKMFNLFGGTEESLKRRNDLSLRDAPAGSNKVQFRKPNTATQGLTLGLKFKEGFNKAIYIDKILPNTEAARLKEAGKIKEGDEVTMVSATFGDEMWSARGVGKYRLEKSISVRQGMTISFVFENQDKGSKKRSTDLKKAKEQEAARMTRLQKQLAKEVEEDQGKGWWR